MTDFQRVIDYLFTIWGQVWNVIRANFLLGISFMVIILGSVIELLRLAKNDK